MWKIYLRWCACAVLCAAALVMIAVYSEPVGRMLEWMVGEGSSKGMMAGAMVGAVILVLMVSTNALSRYRQTLKSFREECESELDDIKVFTQRASIYILSTDYKNLLETLWKGRGTREAIQLEVVPLIMEEVPSEKRVLFLWRIIYALRDKVLVQDLEGLKIDPKVFESARRGSPIDTRVIPGSSKRSGLRTSLI